MLEHLEQRRFLSCTVLQVRETLTILGDRTANHVEIRDLGTRGVRVQCEVGDPQIFTGIERIVASTGAGDDVLRYFVDNPEIKPAPRQLQVNLGSGNDLFQAAVGDPEIRTRVGRLDLSVLGGAGQDRFDLRANNVLFEDPDHVGDPNIFDFRGEDGNDTFNLRLQGVGVEDPNIRVTVNVLGGGGSDHESVGIYDPDLRLNGLLDIVMSGEDGNDELRADIDLGGRGDGTRAGQVRALLQGGAGDDTLRLTARGIYDPELFAGLVSGGIGFDRAEVTDNVTALGCEAVTTIK